MIFDEGGPTNKTRAYLDQDTRIHFEIGHKVEKFTVHHLQSPHAIGDSNDYYYTDNDPSIAYVLSKPGNPVLLSLDFKNDTALFSSNPIDLRVHPEANETYILELATQNDLQFEDGKVKATPIELNTTDGAEQRFRIPFQYPLTLQFKLKFADNVTQEVMLELIDKFSSFNHRFSLQFNSTASKSLLPDLEDYSRNYLRNSMSKIAELTPTEVVLASPYPFSTSTRMITLIDDCKEKPSERQPTGVHMEEEACKVHRVCFKPCSAKLYEVPKATPREMSMAQMSFRVPNNYSNSNVGKICLFSAAIVIVLIGVAVSVYYYRKP